MSWFKTDLWVRQVSIWPTYQLPEARCSEVIHLIHHHTPHTPSYTIITLSYTVIHHLVWRAGGRDSVQSLVLGWPRGTDRKETVRTKQDGGVRGRGAHLPPQTHQKTTTGGTALTANELETGGRSPYNQDCKKTHPELRRRQERLSDWDLRPWERTRRKGELLWVGRSVLGSEWFEPQTGCPILGSSAGETSPQAGRRVTGRKRREVGSLDSARGERACAGPAQGGEGLPQWVLGFLQTPGCAPAPRAHSTPQLGADRGRQLLPGADSTVGRQGDCASVSNKERKCGLKFSSMEEKARKSFYLHQTWG